MSMIERSGNTIIRTFEAGDELPSPWDNVRAIRDSDTFAEPAAPLESAPSQKTIEGLGWVMVSIVELEIAGTQGLLAGVGSFDVEAA